MKRNPARMVQKKLIRELPPVGTKLNAKFHGIKYKANIVTDRKSPNGRAVKFDGRLYQSMTAAAKAITDYNVNGWRFWRY